MIIQRLMAACAVIVGLCAPAVAQNYVPVQWYEVDAASARVQALFPEADGLLGAGQRAPRVVFADIAHPTGPLTFAMWVGPGMCGLNTCGLKIFNAQDDYLGGAEVCDQPEAITIDPHNENVRLCSDTARPVVNLMWSQPPAVATQTVDRWQGEDVFYLNHNGSTMAVSPGQGTITYERVRDGLRNSVADGSVLFTGEPWQPGGAFTGTAYTFRKGCAPAPYAVTASYEGIEEALILRGAAPVRVKGGCQVTGYTENSDNAVLSFHTTFD